MGLMTRNVLVLLLVLGQICLNDLALKICTTINVLVLLPVFGKNCMNDLA